MWPSTREDLEAAQVRLAAEAAGRGARPLGRPRLVAGCFVCFERGPTGPGRTGEPAWAGAALLEAGRLVATVSVTGEAGAPYEPGLLALREGPTLERAVKALPQQPELLLADATGRDHPRRAGLATQLGAVLGVPTIGVTHRPLVAEGEWPAPERGASAPLTIDGEVVGSWLRTKSRARPLAIHPAWAIDPDEAVALVLASIKRARTPEPLRQARRAAREARAGRR